MKNNDAQLIQRTLAGDETAFSTLVRKYQKPVHALVWRKIGDFHIAEEITQDVFLRVYKKLQTLKDVNRFAGWLYVIAARRCFAWCKKKRIPMKSLDALSTEELEELAYTHHQVEQQAEGVNERQREVVKRLLQKLPESERTVVTLHYLGDMTCEDISKFLGVSPNTVKSRLHRARQRLKKEEQMVRETLEDFQFTTSLSENILQEIARIKPAAPSSGKPWMPWAVAASTAALVLLLLGSGTQYLHRFQQPYSFEATSEMTVELVDTSVVRASKQKLSARNQIGNTEIPGKNSGSANRDADALQVIADPSDQLEKPAIIKSRWIPMGGPEGTSGGRVGLFATAKRALYAVAARGIYRLTEDENAWTLICESTPTHQFQMPMAERDDTLYVLTPDELLASTDAGKTWDTVGPRPEGRAFELLITDKAFYLVFEKHIFRSDDVGKSWIPMMQDLQAYITRTNNSPEISISDAVALDNIVFIGTNQGLYRLAMGVWKELAVPYQRFDAARGHWYHSSMDKFINSLVVSENRLYVIAGSDFARYSDSAEESRSLGTSIRFHLSLPRVFRSTDFGDSWVNISPSEDKAWIAIPPTEVNSPLRQFSGLQLVAVGETLVVMGNLLHMHSTDSGDTWTNPEIGDYHSMNQSIFPVVALDENNFYTSDISGIARSTDGGTSWSPFTKGMVNSHVRSLILVGETLYALTAEEAVKSEVVKSIDRGESWESVPIKATVEFPPDNWTEKKYPVPGFLTHAKIGKTDDVLYVISNGVTKVHFKHLSADDNMLVYIDKDIPDFGEDSLSAQWFKKFEEAKKISPDMVNEISRQRTADIPNIMEEQRTNGGFTMDGETFFMEFRKKLFRWRKGEAE